MTATQFSFVEALKERDNGKVVMEKREIKLLKHHFR